MRFNVEIHLGLCFSSLEKAEALFIQVRIYIAVNCVSKDLLWTDVQPVSSRFCQLITSGKRLSFGPLRRTFGVRCSHTLRKLLSLIFKLPLLEECVDYS